jgi:hypothetical protein
LPVSCIRSAAERRFEIRPSRWLLIWWLALHVSLALSAFMVSGPVGIVALPLIALHGRLRRPAEPSVIQVTPGGRFGLPEEFRFDLAIAPGTREGPGWLLLEFSDRPGRRLLLLRDQLDADAWRELRLRILERP